MRTTHRSLIRPAMFAAAFALICFSPANAQQPEPAISLLRPISAEASLAPRKSENKASLDYHEFARARVGRESEAEVFTLRFNQATKVTGISAGADFHVTGGTCIDGHTYSVGNECSVEVAFTPKGPGHRTGQLSVSHTASATPFLTPIGGFAYGPVISFIPALIQTVPGTYSGGGTLLNPQGLAIDGGDNLYIADTAHNLIKFRDSSGTISTLVGGGNPAILGYTLNGPRGVAVDYAGTLFISDTGDSLVLTRAVDDARAALVGGGTNAGTQCRFVSPCQPTSVFINPPYAVTTDPSGNVYFTFQVSGVRGFYIGEYEADIYKFYLPQTNNYNEYTTSPSVGVDLYSNLYYTYAGGTLLGPSPLCYVLAQNYAYSTSSPGARVWTVAGSGKCGFSGDGGKATGAEISTSIGQFAFDVASNLYFADTGNNRVRRVDVASGVIHTIAGNGGVGYGGDGGGATSAQIHSPIGVAVDSMGQVYVTGLVSAANNAVVRQVSTVGQLTFAAQATATHSAVQTILISNTGNDILNFIHFAMTAGNTTEFAIDPNTTSCVLTLPLLSGKSCNIGIIFTPAAAGARSAVLTILDDTITGSNTIQLTGTGALPAKAVLAPTTEAFPSQTVNTASAAKVLTFSNTGGLPLTISSYAFSGTNATDFTQTHTCGTTLAGAGTCSISVVFKPLAVGARSGTLTVVTTGGTVTATLTGTGAAAPAVATLAPASLSFAAQTASTVSAAKAFTLSNTGGSPLTITSYSFTGTNVADFPQTHTCGTSLAAGAGCSISVTFKPAAAGARSANLSVVTSAGTVTRTVSGTGVAAAVASKITLSSKVNPAADGQSVILISTVEAASSAIPTGKVRLMEGTTFLAETDLNAGAVTFKQLNLLPGRHMLVSSYLGDNLHKPSISAAIQQVIRTGIRPRLPIKRGPRQPLRSSPE